MNKRFPSPSYNNFASDNNAGVHPAVLQALHEVNIGYAVAYGDDPYTASVQETIQDLFDPASEVFFVFGGTGANVLALKQLTRSYHSILCPESAHIYCDECGAPETFTGCKLLPIPSHDGKINIEGIRRHLHGFDFEHHAQPKVVSISQATEYGTVYTADEIRSITKFVHSYDMYVHMDGARLCNAAVHLDVPLRAITTDVGVDVLSFGGTKNGLMMGECLIFLNPQLAKNFKYVRKQGMQLAAKMRFIAAQYQAYFSDDLWRQNARHANEAATLLAREIEQIPEITITQKVESNAVFALVPAEYIPVIQEQFFFYVWNEETSEVRWMTSFNTTEEQVRDFVSCIKETIARRTS